MEKKKTLSIIHLLLLLLLFSRSVVSDSLRPHGLQHARLPCPSPSPGVCSNSCPLSQWWPSNHLTLCHPLLPLLSIFPSIRVFSNELASNGRSIGASASTFVHPTNIQGWVLLGLIGLISLQSKGSVDHKYSLPICSLFSLYLCCVLVAVWISNFN